MAQCELTRDEIKYEAVPMRGVSAGSTSLTRRPWRRPRNRPGGRAVLETAGRWLTGARLAGARIYQYVKVSLSNQTE